MDKFYTWLSASGSSKSFIYYRGDLSADRSLFGGSNTKTPQQMEAGLIGRAAWQAYERGLVTLIRKRVGPVGTCMFEYIAVRSRPAQRHMGAIEECSGVAA